jgi:hypothetical protein
VSDSQLVPVPAQRPRPSHHSFSPLLDPISPILASTHPSPPNPPPNLTPVAILSPYISPSSFPLSLFTVDTLFVSPATFLATNGRSLDRLALDIDRPTWVISQLDILTTRHSLKPVAL